MDYISLFTALARILVLVPLVMFFWKQSHIYAKNGDVGRVRLATLLLTLFLMLMFGNLVWVNMTSAINNLNQGITLARWVALCSSWLLAASLWHTWFLFKRIQQ